MPWDYILTGAGSAGIAAVLLLIFAKKFIESGVETQFQSRIEELRSELDRQVERLKTELDVWGAMRKDILGQVREAHKSIIEVMAKAIIAVQEPFVFMDVPAMQETLRDKEERHRITNQLAESLWEFRKINHNTIHLVSEEGGAICQRFFDAGFELVQMLTGKVQSAGAYQVVELKSMMSALAESYTQGIDHENAEATAPQFDALAFVQKLQTLKNERRAFYGHVAKIFGLEKLLPWMVQADA